MSTETTPAMRRAYAAADEAAVSVTPPDGVSMEAWLDAHGSLAYRHGMVHAGLADALDIEEMAEGACRAIHSTRWDFALITEPCDECWATAAAWRAAILGGAA